MGEFEIAEIMLIYSDVRDLGATKKYRVKSHILVRERCTNGDTSSGLAKNGSHGSNSCLNLKDILLLAQTSNI